MVIITPRTTVGIHIHTTRIIPGSVTITAETFRLHRTQAPSRRAAPSVHRRALPLLAAAGSAPSGIRPRSHEPNRHFTASQLAGQSRGSRAYVSHAGRHSLLG